MKRRFQKHYTILIAPTGSTPITLSFQPFLVVLTLALLVSLPLVSVVKVVSSYAQKNNQLTEQNNSLTQEASNILEQVEVLETEIDTLQQRAGLEEGTSAPSEVRPEGGVGTPVEAEILLAVARSKLPFLESALRGEVQPALEQTLDRENARPVGVPLKRPSDISSQFGVRRNPFGRSYEFHSGLDFKGTIGTPIHATAPGVVIKAEWNGGYGYHVIVDHGYGYQTLYAHLSRMAVTQGTPIERDRVVGFLGNTGRSSGPHLHYGVYRNGHAVDPKSYLN